MNTIFRVPRAVRIIAPIAVGALAALAAYYLGGIPAFQVAAFAAAHTVTRQLLDELQDKTDLEVTVGLEPFTLKAPTDLVVRIVNRGPRPAVILAVGVSVADSKDALTTAYYPWRDDRGATHESGALHIKLDESDAVALTTATGGVFTLGGEYARWIFVRPSHGRAVWRRMPSAYFDALPLYDAQSRQLPAPAATVTIPRSALDRAGPAKTPSGRDRKR